MTTDLQIHLPTLFQKQIDIIQHPARFKVLACGRRFGKTVVGKEQLVQRMLDGRDTAYFTLTRKNANDMWEEVKAAIDVIITKKNETDRTIKVITGGALTIWSLDKPVSSRGQGYDDIVWDEVGYTRNAGRAWNRVIRPFLAFSRGSCLFLSSPNGTGNFFHEIFERGQSDDPRFKHWQSWNYPTWDNPLITAAEIADIQASTSQDEFDTEYGAIFGSVMGRVYDNWTVENISIHADYQPDKPVWWSCDDGYTLGKGRGDVTYHPRIIQFLQHNALGGVNVFDEYIATHETHETSIKACLKKSYKKPFAVYVPGEAVGFRDEFNRQGIANVNGTHIVVEGIKNVRRMICNAAGVRLLKVHPRCENLIYEMDKYRYDENNRTKSGEREPTKIDDHSADCLRYGTYHLRMAIR